MIVKLAADLSESRTLQMVVLRYLHDHVSTVDQITKLIIFFYQTLRRLLATLDIVLENKNISTHRLKAVIHDCSIQYNASLNIDSRN